MPTFTRAERIACITYLVAKAVGIAPSDIRVKRRFNRLVWARNAIRYLAKVHCPNLSLVYIGHRTGHVHHSTVIYSLRLLQNDASHPSWAIIRDVEEAVMSAIAHLDSGRPLVLDPPVTPAPNYMPIKPAFGYIDEDGGIIIHDWAV